MLRKIEQKDRKNLGSLVRQSFHSSPGQDTSKLSLHEENNHPYVLWGNFFYSWFSVISNKAQPKPIQELNPWNPVFSQQSHFVRASISGMQQGQSQTLYQRNVSLKTPWGESRETSVVPFFEYITNQQAAPGWPRVLTTKISIVAPGKTKQNMLSPNN